jgi:predicted Fe-Mo cluster-binding NifX family protein
LICGKLGPVAFQILKNAEIKVYKIIPGNVEKNLERFSEGKLEEITSLSRGFPL